MSIEQTHLILMCKGPESDEFNMTNQRCFGNFYTTLEHKIMDFYFFLKDGLF